MRGSTLAIRRMTAGLVGGLLLAASLPPWPSPSGMWPLGLVGAGALCAASAGGRRANRLAVGLAAGLGLYLPGLWWMRAFSVPGYVVAVTLEAAILSFALVLVPRIDGRWRMVAFPAALVLAEAVRGVWPFGGLPLAGIDLGQVAGPLGPVAALGGGPALVGLVGLAGAGLAAAWRRRWAGAAVAGAVVFGTVAAGMAATAGSGAVSTRAPLRTAAVQGGGERGLRAIDSDPTQVLQAHLDASAALVTAADAVELVLWPEDVIDVDSLAGSPADEALSGLARTLKATVVAGVVEDIGPLRFRNATVVWGPDGSRLDRYDKVHRVPFGEYVPARALFERLADLSAVPRDAIAGRGAGVVATPVGRMGVLISFEVFFADRARAAVRAGAEVLLVPTNASSYGDSQVPAQEVVVARLRALETGRWVVQAAPTGYSAVIDPRGRVLERSQLGRPEVLRAAIPRLKGVTLAVRLGGWPWPVAAIALLLAANVRPRARGPDSPEEPGG